MKLCGIAVSAVLALVIGGADKACADALADGPAALLHAQASALHLEPTWLRLGRYQRARITPSAHYQSSVISEGFFLAPAGARDPAAELEATLTGVLQPFDAQTAEDHVLCRYPARSAWLAKRLALRIPRSVEVCPGFREWARDGAITGVSVIFASGYLSNPGSAYGHLLLRFHSEGPGGRHDLLETSINYGAADSEGDPFFSYIFRGLTGRYHSTFTDLEYFNHNQRYRESQLRDVWSYRLNLSQADVDFLVAHTWEMLGQENRYYFLRQNCAYRIAELVSIVADDPLISTWKPWVAPLDVFQRLSVLSQNGAPLVSDVDHLPSRQTAFRRGYEGLPRDGRRLVDGIAAGGDVHTTLLASSVEPQTKAAALDVALDYGIFARRAGSDTLSEEDHTQLLLARLGLPPSRSLDEDGPDAAPPPHAGQHTSLFQVSPLYNDAFGGGLELRVRAAYNDFLSPTPGTVPYSELSMGDLRLVARNGDLDLRQLELVRVTALNVTETGLGGDGGHAWGVRFGFEDRDLACDDCLVSYAEGHIGKATKLPGAAAFVLLTGRLQALDANDNHAQAGATLGFLVGDGPWKASLIGGVLQEIDGARDARPFVRAETRLGGSRRWDVRFDIEHREALESRSRFSVYW